MNRGETDRGEGPWLLSLPCWRPGCYCRPCAWLWLKWWVDRGGWNLLYLGFSWDKGPWKGLWMSWVDVIGCAVMDLVKVIKSPNTGLCVVTTWLYSIKRKTSLRYFLFLLSICCGDKLKWNIFCGLSSLSCMDTYLLSQGEESPLPFLAEKIFISGRMEDFFLVFHGQPWQRWRSVGTDTHRNTPALSPERESPLSKQDTSTLLTGSKTVVSLQDYFCFYTFFFFFLLDPIFLFSSVGLTAPLRWY